MQTLKTLGLGSIGLAVSPLASAGSGITVNWEATSTSIPTLGSWGLIVMAIVMGVVGARLIKRHALAARTFSITLLAGALLLGVQTARTGGDMVPIGDDECEAGSATYFAFAPATLLNECPNPVRIVSYIEPTETGSCFNVINDCPVGTLVGGDGGMCDLLYYEQFKCEEEGR